MSGSYTKINYRLRPAKAIERKIISNSLLSLRPFGRVSDYRYIGFGSTYFVDFSLFHKVLHIEDMISIEKDSHSKNRFEYNKPFRCIDMRYGESNEILRQLTWEKRVITWLDYDDPLKQSILDDIECVISNIMSGSVFILSVSCQEDNPPDRNQSDYKVEELKKFKQDKLYERISPKNIPNNINSKDLMGKKLGETYETIIRNQIKQVIANLNSTLDPSKKIIDQQIFNFRYSDGANMMTIGWLFFAEEDRETARQCLFDQSFDQDRPYFISVPNLTLKEQQLLDKYMPIILNEKQKQESLYEEIQRNYCINKKDVENYAKIYKYFPSFVEMVI